MLVTCWSRNVHLHSTTSPYSGGPSGPGGTSMKTHRARGTRTRLFVMLTALAAAGVSGVGLASAFTYTTGEVLYVAYQYPNGPDYIVDLGTRTTFVNATTTITLPDVLASDLNTIIGSSGPAGANIFVG